MKVFLHKRKIFVNNLKTLFRI